MESSLTLKKADFETKIGRFLGYGGGANADDTAWTAKQEAAIKDCLDSGYHRFLYPALQDGTTYDWSFLKPVKNLSVASGSSTLVLPDDFGGLNGPIFIVDSSRTTREVEVSGDVRRRVALNPSATGEPQYVEVEWLKGTSQQEGQRAQLRIWPTTDDDYTLQVPYYLLAEALTDRNPYCYGNVQHREVILESMLAIAEKRIDDTASVHSKEFDRLLMPAVDADRRLKPQKMGYNADRSSGMWGRNRNPWQSTVTFDGVTYE